ncbi:hypothetical protein [Stenotrophomonas sp. NPDC078853]
MPVWLTAGQADDWLAAEPDEAMAMLLASEPRRWRPIASAAL